MTIVNHLERHLGEIARGWTKPDEPGSPQVVKFLDVPTEHVCTYVTLGLSTHVLRMRHDRQVRQELLLAATCDTNEDSIARFLQGVARGLLIDHRAVLCGELVGDGTPIVAGGGTVGAFAAAPTLFDDSFYTYEGSSPPTVLVWLVPITEREARYVRHDSWEAFATILESSAVDLFDLNRTSTV